MGGVKGVGPVGTSINLPVVDGGTLVCSASPQSGPVGIHNYQQEFEAAFSLLKAEISNSAFIATVENKKGS